MSTATVSYVVSISRMGRRWIATHAKLGRLAGDFATWGDAGRAAAKVWPNSTLTVN